MAKHRVCEGERGSVCCGGGAGVVLEGCMVEREDDTVREGHNENIGAVST